MLYFYSDFIPSLQTLKPEDWNKKVTDKWTVKDVVAHMVGWEKGDVEVIRMTWKTKKVPWFYETHDYDDFNRNAVEFYKNYTPQELIKEWEKWQNKVQEEINRIGEYKMKTRPDLFGWLFEEGENTHYNYHYRQIKNALEKY